MKLARATLLLATACAAAVATLSPSFAAERAGAAKLAFEIDIDGAIGPATARQVKEALATAAERRAEVVILRLNTPGGLVTSMREIIADVLASPVPVVGYVAPSGAHAASAGTYILYATHVAAMAPGTNLGAATPVEIGGPFRPCLPSLTRQGRQGRRRPVGHAGRATGCHDGEGDQRRRRLDPQPRRAARPQCRLGGEGGARGREPVGQCRAAGNVIDLVARDPTELLAQIDGRTVEVAGGETRHLATRA